ncbi:MAG TPA: phosphatase PAP2 family protein [Verrucomicrobiae bacterium]|nr:phosphatase PAP2 family protein [Verrucomicrobiae bacterium]
MTGELEIIHGIQSLLGADWGRDLAVFASRYLVFVFVLMAAALGYGKKRLAWRRTAYDAAWAALLAMVIANAIGWLVQRPRPYIVSSDILQLIPPPLTSASFPSGHTSVAFAAAAAITLGAPEIGVPALVLATLVGLGRVAVGVHYPTDVFAGAMLGILCAYAVRFARPYVSRWLKRPKSSAS